MPLEMADPDGNPVNAVLGFARFLVDLLEGRRPERLAFAFDESLETSYRNEIFPAYKANRERRRRSSSDRSGSAGSFAARLASPSLRAPATRPTTSSARWPCERRAGACPSRS
jgi:5'-3' exonuclease